MNKVFIIFYRNAIIPRLMCSVSLKPLIRTVQQMKETS